MIIVKEQIVAYVLPYNEQLQNSFTDEINTPYFGLCAINCDTICFDSENEFSKWFDKKYSELMEYEHWIDIDKNDNLEYVCWDRNESINCDISISVKRSDDE